MGTFFGRLRETMSTVPPPYSPCGMVPSKVLYSIGWSSTWTARRFSPGTRLGPRVTAQLFITPPEPQVIMKTARRMLLNDELVTLAPAHMPARLRRDCEFAFATLRSLLRPERTP